MTSPRKSRVGSNNGQFVHGFSGSPEYKTWSAIKRRCMNKKDTKWHIYGGRGIKVCREWQQSFLAFYNHVGPKPSKRHSIDRKNINGHYEPGNVRWATPAEQSRNMRTNRFITFGSRTMIEKDWATEAGITADALRYRLRRWPLGTALSRSKQPGVAAKAKRGKGK